MSYPKITDNNFYEKISSKYKKYKIKKKFLLDCNYAMYKKRAEPVKAKKRMDPAILQQRVEIFIVWCL